MTVRYCSMCGKVHEDTTDGCIKASATRRTPHKCPVCDGSGKVSRPPHIAGDIPTWVGTSTEPYECQACVGSGVVWSDD